MWKTNCGIASDALPKGDGRKRFTVAGFARIQQFGREMCPAELLRVQLRYRLVSYFLPVAENECRFINPNGGGT